MLWESIPNIDQPDIWIHAGLRSMERKLFSSGVGLIDAAIWIAAEATDAQIITLDTKLSRILPTDRLTTFD